ncbi:MAG: recombinase RecA [Planctomycetota bacterium]|nr:MAG: recombinase RecA [Planctomycetota bacterium]
MSASRLSTGLSRLDELLGGGLLPGTMTVVLGATGIGKTQLGIHFANAGRSQEGERGVFFDMTSRGDSQSHADYAQRMYDWTITEQSPDIPLLLPEIWDRSKVRRDSLHVFKQTGKRVTMSDLDDDQKIEWKAELNRKLEQTIAFFYGNFVQGVRRCVIDGMEPADRASDSFQFERFEYIYQQILRKESEWVARDLFRAHYRENAEIIARHAYDHSGIGCLLLCTTHETMLDALIERPIESGDVLSNANTIILMGKTKVDGKMGRALHVSKHRGSACQEEIVPYSIDASGLVLDA